MSSFSKAKYIASIDSLRAISVLAVIAFHYLPDITNAGYLGVDVFFVISGFVITASLLNYERPTTLKDFSIQFYLKRFRRLLPALIAVVVFTILMIMLLITEGKDSIRTGALSLIGGANFFLYIKEADYFALTSELNPFTHMWSLAVEDQFYLLFPLLIWWGGYFKIDNTTNSIANQFKILSAICGLSFIGFIFSYKIDYAFAFYMMPTRLWEIGAGILIYLLVSHTNKVAFLKNIPIVLPSIILISILSFGYLAPLLAHIFVVLVTAICLGILWYQQDRQTLLTSALPVYLGKISYSLYLWHWPFIVLAKHTVGTSPLNVIVCIFLTFVFAVISYHFIEQPLRHYKRPPSTEARYKQFQKLFTCIIASTLFLYIGLSRYAPKQDNLLTYFIDVPATPASSRHPCHGKRTLRKYDDPLKFCLGAKRTNDKPQKVFLLGDSHANQYANMISQTIKETKYQLQFINSESKSDGIIGLISKEDYLPADFDYMLKNAIDGDVFILSFHNGYLNNNRDQHINLNQAIKLNDSTNNFIINLRPILTTLKNRGVKVMLFYDSPLMAYVSTVRSCVIQLRLGNQNNCQVSRQQAEHTRTRQALAYSILKENITDLNFWDPLNSIFRGRQYHNVIDNEGHYLMHDWSHITEKLASHLQPDFEKTFNNMTRRDD